MLDFSSELDNGEFDTLEDYSPVTANSPTITTPTIKYDRRSRTNIDWSKVFTYEPDQQDSEIHGLKKCLHFMKTDGDFDCYQSQGIYGKVLRCVGHNDCDTMYRYGFSANEGLFFVESNNVQHNISSIKITNVGIPNFLRDKVIFFLYYMLLFNLYIYRSYIKD